MKKIVWISPYLPYKSVPHAGGKTCYFYLRKLIECGEFDVSLIAFYESNELSKFDLADKLECKLYPSYENVCGTRVKKSLSKFCDFVKRKNPYRRYVGIINGYFKRKILSSLIKNKKQNIIPNIIILEWTQAVLLSSDIKKILPNTKIISIEEDVTLLSYKRRIDFAQGRLRRYYAKARFRTIEKQEIKALNDSDLIIVNNYKDFKLLTDYSVPEEKLRQWVTYYEDYCEVQLQAHNNTVIFYGAMVRAENYLSAIWFVENVMPLLSNTDIKFVVIGNKPPDCLKQYANDRVIITGFVDDVKPYFACAVCLAAPLILGAGIKVKILEAFSSGLPVLTNEIGIEGIQAKDGEEYYFCKTADDYANIIKYLLSHPEQRNSMGEKARRFVLDNFSYLKAADLFVGWIKEFN